MLLITVQPGEEVIETLGALLAERGVAYGAIVSLIGAVDSCKISNMAEDDHLSNIPTHFTGPQELSGAGEIRAGTVHIHCTVSGENADAFHGHLHWARVDNNFVNAYVLPC